MPQARIRTSTSPGPTCGRSASSTSALPGPVTMDTFMAWPPVRCRRCQVFGEDRLELFDAQAVLVEAVGVEGEQVLRMLGEPIPHARFGFGGQRLAGPVVDAAHDVHRVAHHLVVVHVEETVVADAIAGPQRPFDVVSHLRTSRCAPWLQSIALGVHHHPLAAASTGCTATRSPCRGRGAPRSAGRRGTPSARPRCAPNATASSGSRCPVLWIAAPADNASGTRRCCVMSASSNSHSA